MYTISRKLYLLIKLIYEHTCNKVWTIVTRIEIRVRWSAIHWILYNNNVKAWQIWKTQPRDLCIRACIDQTEIYISTGGYVPISTTRVFLRKYIYFYYSIHNICGDINLSSISLWACICCFNAKSGRGDAGRGRLQNWKNISMISRNRCYFLTLI